MRPMNNIVNNQVLYKDGEYLSVDSKEIIAKVKELTKNLLK